MPDNIVTQLVLLGSLAHNAVSDQTGEAAIPLVWEVLLVTREDELVAGHCPGVVVGILLGEGGRHVA